MLIYNIYIHTGWWYTYPSEKYEFVSWDDDVPNIWRNTIHVPNHQPVITSCSAKKRKPERDL